MNKIKDPDFRLKKVRSDWTRIQLLQDELLERFKSEHPPVWIHPIEELSELSSPPSYLFMP